MSLWTRWGLVQKRTPQLHGSVLLEVRGGHLLLLLCLLLHSTCLGQGTQRHCSKPA